MASKKSSIVWKLLMILTLILASTVGARKLGAGSHIAHIKHEEVGSKNAPPPPKFPGDGPGDDAWNGNF